MLYVCTYTVPILFVHLFGQGQTPRSPGLDNEVLHSVSHWVAPSHKARSCRRAEAHAVVVTQLKKKPTKNMEGMAYYTHTNTHVGKDVWLIKTEKRDAVISLGIDRRSVQHVKT